MLYYMLRKCCMNAVACESLTQMSLADMPNDCSCCSDVDALHLSAVIFKDGRRLLLNHFESDAQVVCLLDVYAHTLT